MQQKYSYVHLSDAEAGAMLSVRKKISLQSDKFFMFVSYAHHPKKILTKCMGFKIW
jgi:hypothetical protein